MLGVSRKKKSIFHIMGGGYPKFLELPGERQKFRIADSYAKSRSGEQNWREPPPIRQNRSAILHNVPAYAMFASGIIATRGSLPLANMGGGLRRYGASRNRIRSVI